MKDKLPYIPRARDGSSLISEWCNVETDDGQKHKAYYHVWFGWMIESKRHKAFKYGYVQLDNNVIKWVQTTVGTKR